jgi:hypothetical protein
MGAGVPDEPESVRPSVLPEVPPLPQRAAIYITRDGNVKFGALFEDLLPVAAAVAATEPADLLPPPSSPELGE